MCAILCLHNLLLITVILCFMAVNKQQYFIFFFDANDIVLMLYIYSLLSTLCSTSYNLPPPPHLLFLHAEEIFVPGFPRICMICEKGEKKRHKNGKMGETPLTESRERWGLGRATPQRRPVVVQVR